MGWLKYAFIFSFYCLLRHQDYLKDENKNKNLYFDALK